MQTNMEKRHELRHRKGKLIGYDLVMWLVAFLINTIGCGLAGLSVGKMAWWVLPAEYLLMGAVMIGMRIVMHVYSQVWRYSRVNSYLQLVMADFAACLLMIVLNWLLRLPGFSLHRIMTLATGNLVGAISIRLLYTWLFETAATSEKLRACFVGNGRLVRLMNRVIFAFTGISVASEAEKSAMPETNKIRIAIVGAGRIGTMLAEELLSNRNAVYTPVCFIDTDREKVDRRIAGIEVLAPGKDTKDRLTQLAVQEIVFAVNKQPEERAALYAKYKNMGFKIKVYTLPLESAQEDGRRQIREYEAEELLFRKQLDFLGEQTRSFYQDKVVLVSGGGGSIGSELSRQIAKMKPKQLILLDIYENNVYDIQQEMRVTYGDSLNLAVEIASVRDAAQLDKVFRTYRPQIVLHAAAHKHVPLMEHNCSEAVKNNVFGTNNMVKTAEKYGVEKFIMVSTDKAVNPTNVMGASKRLCEMIVLSHAASQSKTSFCCTRFGNVLGSNGSVIPLFKRQIANGGPITLTDKRIIRYFMTIPEASQLVLASGAMGQSGQLFVLDMGRPVKILDLAENMIRLSGLEPYKDIDIIETGLRPGEKLFEELLIKTEKLTKTDNEKIFIEQDEALSLEEIDAKLDVLRKALATEDDDQIRLAMKKVVPTFHSPKHVNRDALADGRYEKEAEGRGQVMAG